LAALPDALPDEPPDEPPEEVPGDHEPPGVGTTTPPVAVEFAAWMNVTPPEQWSQAWGWYTTAPPGVGPEHGTGL